MARWYWMWSYIWPLLYVSDLEEKSEAHKFSLGENILPLISRLADMHRISVQETYSNQPRVEKRRLIRFA